jgi:hypothetical protein
VWPWLAQMGSGRAGWYAYDFIDNGGAPQRRTNPARVPKHRRWHRIPRTPGSEGRVRRRAV